VISHGYWERRFGSDPAVVGKTFRRLSTVFTIVGVTPPEFEGVVFGRVPDITIPASMADEVQGGRPGSWLRESGTHWLAVIGRLKPGVSITQAETELQGIFARMVAQEASVTEGDRRQRELLEQRVELRAAANGIDDWRRDLTEPLAILMGTVLLLLLLACANVANLLLTKSAARQREIAVRLALGAGRGRVARQMLAEGLLLAIAGGSVGVVLSYGLASGLVAMMTNGGRPVALATSPDARILAFALLVSLGSCLLFSLAPVIQATRANVQSALAEMRSARWRLGKGLVIAQMAISVLLLIGAGLFSRTLLEMYSQDSGFRAQGLVLFSTNLTRLGYAPERLEPLWEGLRTELQMIPGVEKVTMSSFPPVSGGSGWDARIRVEGYTHGPGDNNVSHGNRVGPNYFQTYGTPLIAGRDFDESDRQNSELVAIVNESFARDYFRGQALGKRIGPDYPGQTGWFRIIGIVRDMKYESLRADAPRAVYFPFAQVLAGNATFALRTDRHPASLSSEIQAAVTRVDPSGRAQAIRTMETHVARSLLTERMLASLGASFGGVALLLGAVGIYGVMAYQVARRRREIGVRVALGATAKTVVGMILRQTAALTLAGSVIGAVGGLALSELARGLLFGIEPNDPFTFAAAIGSLLLVALGAAYLPGRRAAQTNPVETLRAE
jgi:predicted permease